MILSIGMIVKNEEKYLERCLTGLKPILDNVDSELIIADTGSTDRTVEIAKQFTDNVFFFEWINDFAAARNSTIEKAKGEWYMFVDGDEIFKSCDEIIHFFNSGEYKKYNSASFNIRNFLNVELDTYADFNGPRLTKILPNTKFVGEIHESLTTYGAPFKRLTDTAEHYGYVYDSENDYTEKQRRNSELLLKRYEENKDEDERLYSQLYDCFIGTDPARAEKFLEEGIELCKKNKSVVLITLYVSRTFTAYCNSEFEKVVQYSDEYFNLDRDFRPRELTSDGEVLGLKAFALYNLNKYDEAIETFIRFFDVFKRIQSGKLVTYDSFMGTSQMATDKNFVQILNAFCRSCALAGKYNTAASYLATLPIAKYSIVKEYVDILVSFEMDLLKHFNYEDAYKYFKQLDPGGKRLFKEQLCNLIYQSDDAEKVIKAVIDISKGDEELTEKIDIYNCYFNNRPVDESKLFEFAGKYNINENADLFMIAVDKKFDVSPLFDLPEFDMKLCIYMCYMRVYGFAKAIENYSADCIKDYKFIPQMLKYLELCMKTVPIYRAPKSGVFVKLSVDRLFENYAKLGKRYAEESGIPEEELSSEIKAALIAENIMNLCGEKKFKECFAAMKEAITVYPGIAAVIDEYQKTVMKEYEKVQNNNPEMEMRRLASEVKKSIRRYIAAGNFDAARKTLDQFKLLAPNDPDIDSLYAKINSGS